MGLITNKNLDITDVRLEDVLAAPKIDSWTGWKDIYDSSGKDTVRDLADRIMKYHVTKFLNPLDLARLKGIVMEGNEYPEASDNPNLDRIAVICGWGVKAKLLDSVLDRINSSINKDRKLLRRFGLEKARCGAINFKREFNDFCMNMDIICNHEYDIDSDSSFYTFDTATLIFKSLL